jgi:hypothetical protein
MHAFLSKKCENHYNVINSCHSKMWKLLQCMKTITMSF